MRLWAAILLLCAGALCATLPFLLMLANQHSTDTLTDTHDETVQSIETQQIARELQNAQDYNRRLAEDGSVAMGEATDPWTGGTVSLDPTYRAQLDTPADGIMATIDYPRLGITLPVRHGTDPDTLATGAGHMYGTSLPVGGASTHSVISAHSGLADRLMFDKLSLRQARAGDVFYIRVLDQTLAYTVTDITVIQPDDFTRLRIQPGKDLVTLLTCTPYGVNTQRILVTGTRTTMPDPAPDPKDAPRDRTTPTLIGAWTGLIWLTVTLAAVRALRRRNTPSTRPLPNVFSSRKGKHHAHR